MQLLARIASYQHLKAFCCVKSEDVVLLYCKPMSWPDYPFIKKQILGKLEAYLSCFLQIKDDNQNIEWDYAKGIIEEKA
jgi:hypothetical protein